MSNAKLAEFINYDNEKEIEFKIQSEKILDNNVKLKDISFEGSHENEIRAFLILPNGKGPFPGIHFIHWLETHADNSNRTEFLPMAIELANLGYASILPDCFWSVDKEKYKENPQAYHDKWWKTNFDNDSVLCKNQITDLIMSYNILKKLDNVDGERIGLASHDFGSMFGLLLPSLGFKYKALVMMAATGRFSDWFRFGSNMKEEELQPYISEMDFLDPIVNLKYTSPNKVLFQFADDDFYVPKSKAEEFFSKGDKNCEMKWYSAKHGMNEQAFSDLKNWIMANI